MARRGRLSLSREECHERAAGRLSTAGTFGRHKLGSYVLIEELDRLSRMKPLGMCTRSSAT